MSDSQPPVPRPRRVRRARSILVRYPHLAPEADHERAAALGLDFYAVAPATRALLPWRHVLTGGGEHQWLQSGTSRVHMGAGCSICRGYASSDSTSLAARSPDLAREWHPVLNGSRTPSGATPGSRLQAHWSCSTCGYDWAARISSRAIDGNGCPRCAGQAALPGDPVTLAVAQPELYAELDQSGVEALGLTPSAIHVRSQRQVAWICRLDPSHRWTASPAARMNGCGCRRCPSYARSSTTERRLLELLRRRYDDAIGDAPAGATRWPDSRGRLIPARCDIVVPSKRLVVEYDGLRYHGSSDRRRCDSDKTTALLADGWRVVRIRERAGTRALPDLDVTADHLLQISHRYGDRLSPVVDTIAAWLERLDGHDPVPSVHT